jgi:hypothetical protein
MLNRYGSHMSTQAAVIRIRCDRLNSVVKNSSSVPLFALAAKPNRLAVIQVADHRDELLLLSQMDFVYAHLHQRGLPSRRRPPLQVSQIDRADGACR